VKRWEWLVLAFAMAMITASWICLDVTTGFDRTCWKIALLLAGMVFGMVETSVMWRRVCNDWEKVADDAVKAMETMKGEKK
jgi:hypothetical protein